MWSYLVRRLLLAVPTLVGVSLVAFVLVALSPGDPALAVLGDHFTPKEYAAERARQGLDQPLPLRYLRWGGLVLKGDLGRSTKTKRPVTEGKEEPLAVGHSVAARHGSLVALFVGAGDLDLGWPRWQNQARREPA